VETNQTTELCRKIFNNKLNVEVLCSIYDKKLSTDQIASMLTISAIEAQEIINHLLQIGIVSIISVDQIEKYYLKQPKICDSIIMLKDAVYSLGFHQQ
jgi:predicted transcriptional regulator